MGRSVGVGVRRDSVVQWTLSIWKDFEPRRPLARSEGDEGTQVLGADADLQEEIYSWRVYEDVFAGVSDDDTRADLRERLFERLADAKRPAERRLDVLKQFVDAAQAAIDANAASPHPIESWSDGGSEDEERGVVQINSLLA